MGAHLQGAGGEVLAPLTRTCPPPLHAVSEAAAPTFTGGVGEPHLRRTLSVKMTFQAFCIVFTPQAGASAGPGE